MFKPVFVFLLLVNLYAPAQQTSTSSNILWQAAIHRPDSIDIVFSFTIVQTNKKKVLYILNASEKIKVENIIFRNDSVFIEMPVFESSLRAKVIRGTWEGIWTKGTAGKEQLLPFTAIPHKNRFESTGGPASYNISGRWAVTFGNDKTKAGMAIGEFKQNGNKVSGTFLTPSGDYRYQEGIVTSNQLKLSGFDGAHAYLFTADIEADHRIVNGMFYSGARGKESWTAVKNALAEVSTNSVAMFLKPGAGKLDFHFPNLDGKDVSILDSKFKNKVVVIQLMGSWCPNCMDETDFLSEYYNKNKPRGVEVVALAYEYSTDFYRSVKSLRKFQKRFSVQYPILITGTKVSDSLRTEKTLPQMTPIKVFPTSIILDKKGMVRKIDTGFFGPGTTTHYTDYKKGFYATIDGLLKEK